MVEKSSDCINNYVDACICSTCQHDTENCCGCATFKNYSCPVEDCPEFKHIFMNMFINKEKCDDIS